MIFKKAKFKGLYIITPEFKRDDRGYFARIFAQEEFHDHGLSFNIVHINRSLTKQKGIIRGIHFQKGPHAEDKIVQCLQGAIYDVAIDLRKNSSTFGKWLAEELTEKNKKIFFIPKGFAHGFQTLTDNCEVLYFMSEIYNPELATGVRFNDPFFNIFWPIKHPILSEKDKNWPLINSR